MKNNKKEIHKIEFTKVGKDELYIHQELGSGTYGKDVVSIDMVSDNQFIIFNLPNKKLKIDLMEIMGHLCRIEETK